METNTSVSIQLAAVSFPVTLKFLCRNTCGAVDSTWLLNEAHQGTNRLVTSSVCACF